MTIIIIIIIAIIIIIILTQNRRICLGLVCLTGKYGLSRDVYAKRFPTTTWNTFQMNFFFFI